MATKTGNLGSFPWPWEDNGDGTYTPHVFNTGAGGAGGGDGAVVDGVDPNIAATVVDGATANPLLVSLTDQNGDAVAVGSGTQYTEDAAAAANPVGTALNLIRADALAGLTTTDGDNVAARGTDKGELYVKHADSIAVTHAALTELAGAIDTEMQVDVVTSALPTGAATSAKQDTVIGHLDGVEGILTTIDADTGALAGTVTNTNVRVIQAPHLGLVGDPWTLLHEGVQFTAAQTSTVVVAGGASEKLVVTQVQIQSFNTTAGTAILYFGTGAFARGTNRTIFDGEFAPSATLKGGAILNGPFISGTNGDDLMFTSVGDIDITLSIWYYVVT